MNIKIGSKIALFSVLLFVGLSSMLVFGVKTTNAIKMPFGGRIAAPMLTCDEGFLITVGLPGPTGTYMLTHASYRFTPKNLTTPRPGQLILGLANTAVITPCTISGVPSGGGLLIIAAGGSSL